MKKKILTVLLTSVLATVILAGCSNVKTTNVAEESVTATTVVEIEETTPVVEAEAEAPHEHDFANEEVTTEPTCTTEGEKILTCECGETKKEVIDALGHDFSDYVLNEDAIITIM